MSRPEIPDRMPRGRPVAEVRVDDALASRLISDQHPDLAALPLEQVDAGWDNVIFRLGRDFALRIPRRALADQLLQNELQWLPRIAASLPIPVPAPIRIGQPSGYYPWHWSVLPWFEGACADMTPPASSEALRFADFLTALHQPAPEEAPANEVRGVALSVRASNTRVRIDGLKAKTDLISAGLLALWEHALAAPPSREPRWLHGDLHAQNVLVDDRGAISAVIDWGDITGGDVATDLASIWALFDAPADRRRIIERYAPDAATLLRARGWAFVFGVVLLDSGLISSPRHAEAGRRILIRLAQDLIGAAN